MPSTVRRSQCVRRPAWHCAHAPQAALISPTTRRPTHSGAPGAASTSPTNSWPGHARERVVALHQLEVGVADAGQAHADERLARAVARVPGRRRAGGSRGSSSQRACIGPSLSPGEAALEVEDRAGLALLSGVLLRMGRGVEPDRLVVERVTIDVPGWPAELDGLVVAAVSDIHAGAPHIDRPKLDRLVETVNATRPDVVFLLGDYVIQGVLGGEFIRPEETARSLSRLRARLGVLCRARQPRLVARRHAGAGGPRDARHARAGEPGHAPSAAPAVGSGWPASPTRGRTRYDIPGTLALVPIGAPVILITHNPDLFPNIPERVALTLAGHTHGGQVRLPLIGRPVVPSEYGQRYAAGLVREGGRLLFVTPGIGTSIIPVRFGVPPTVSVLTLRSAPPAAAPTPAEGDQHY